MKKSKVSEKKLVLQKSTISVVNPNAAGIDIGDTMHVVAVPEGSSKDLVREFGTMTCDLQLIVDWLKECKIETVAMESTGVYWKPLFSLLLINNIKVFLVNASHVRNVTGRKNDQLDAQWIQQLHACGLLKSSYLPEEEQEGLRSLVRYRHTLIEDSSRFVLRMQKSLELMNIKIHTVISDLMGKTGRAIIDAIVNGERQAEHLITLVDPRIKADRATIIKSLQGTWREEHLFTLKESYRFYLFYQQEIICCDQAIEKQLIQYEAFIQEGNIELPAKAEATKQKVKKNQKNPLTFNTAHYLQRIHQVNVLAIYGLSEISALEILAETGTDMSKWKSEKHFVSWLNLCPNNKISGGKIISSNILKKKPNLASQAFRTAANSICNSDHWLGDFFRRMRAKGGHKYAIVATAHKIATIYYKMVSCKQEFNPVDLIAYQQKYKTAKIAYLERKLQQLKETA